MGTCALFEILEPIVAGVLSHNAESTANDGSSKQSTPVTNSLTASCSSVGCVVGKHSIGDSSATVKLFELRIGNHKGTWLEKT